MGKQIFNGEYAIVRRIDLRITELDLLYRWPPIPSKPYESVLRFTFQLKVVVLTKVVV